ncbi:hypothetical protein F443_10417 [Phytophthora nicotianae P1569]|uniref:Chromo domain-containing protein n=1 Tax=Phytophthora nicotianae P1569 TaxID=1317065 RepID=V9F3K4_PHYNI|nr:hypothetical protein F443_10417 [Phytophthora nicotianae P1569]
MAYCPWINGSIERLNRDILKVFRTMLLDYKLDTKDWIALVPLVQANLNHSAVPSLGGRAPVEMFTGLPCPSPLEVIFVDTDQGPKNIPVVKSSATFEQQLLELKESVQEMHRQMKDQRAKKTLLNQKQRRGEQPWERERRTRIETQDKSLNVNEELLEHVASQGIVLKVDGVRDHRWNDRIKDYELLMHWHGLEAIEDSWEPMKSVRKDVRLMVENYAKQTSDNDFTAAVVLV